MSRPTIVFVHGAWHYPGCFDKVKEILESNGYRCVAVAMPSVGRIPPVTSLDEDIAAIRAAVVKELDEGRDVVINAHSWGGIPTCSALDGLSKAERQKGGDRSAVVKLAFVSAFMLPEGVSLEDAVGGPADWWIIGDDGTLWLNDFIPRMYHDADPKEAEECVSKLGFHSLATFRAKTRSAAWRKIPSAYLVCEDDRIIPVEGQDGMIAGVKGLGGEIEVERLFVSHSPYLVKPDSVAGFLRRASGEDFREAGKSIE